MLKQSALSPRTWQEGYVQLSIYIHDNMVGRYPKKRREKAQKSIQEKRAAKQNITKEKQNTIV
jgi:hypothetical protein